MSGNPVDGSIDPGDLTTDSNGVKYVTGNVGFSASGTISGANIQSTNVSAGDGTVTGTVVGNFFGDGAEVLGGVSDIVKTRADGAYTDARNVDIFMTCADTPCAGLALP